LQEEKLGVNGAESRITHRPDSSFEGQDWGRTTVQR